MQISLKSFLISVYIWAVIILTMIPLFNVYMVICLLVYPFDCKNHVTHIFMAWWTRLYLTCNPGWKLKIENRTKIDKNKTYILISNHQSIIDIALLLQLKVNFKWVSKIELARVPFVGWVIWLNNHILVKRGDKQSVVKMAEACKKTLQSGISVFMFPEGTRSSEIGTFKDGAFIMAVDNSTPILPVVIDGSGEALPHKGFWFKVRQNFTVRVLDEIKVENHDYADYKHLKSLAESAITTGLKEIRRKEEEIHLLKMHKRIMKKTGFSSDSAGIMERYIQVGDAWENHLQHCREFILNAVNEKKIKTLAVYGSGWLLDFPLESVVSQAEDIYLYDVVHPPQVIHRISQFPNVKAITADLTGGVLWAVYEAVKLYKKNGIVPDLASLLNKRFIPAKDPDYIISLNILSQLGEVISGYLLENIPVGFTAIEIAQRLQNAHMEILPREKSCLITDVEECLYDMNNQLVKNKQLVFCQLPVDHAQNWEWNFDPLGEYNEGMKTVSKVMAYKM